MSEEEGDHLDSWDDLKQESRGLDGEHDQILDVF